MCCETSRPLLSAEKEHWSLPACVTFTVILSYIHVNMRFPQRAVHSGGVLWDQHTVNMTNSRLVWRTSASSHRDERQSVGGLTWASGLWRGIRRLSLESFSPLILLLSLSLCLSSPPVLSFFTLHCSFYSFCLLSAEFTRQWRAQSFFRHRSFVRTNISQRQKTSLSWVKPVDFCLLYLWFIIWIQG